jgi:3-hydroxypropanoate dehydrogenase
MHAGISTGRAPISSQTLDQLFREARTHSSWCPEPVPEQVLREIYDLVRLGPTSANSQPARFVFLVSDQAKHRLLPALLPGNVEKSRTAPVVVLIAWDSEFHEHLPRTFPHADMRSMFAKNHALIDETAFRNSSLEAGYFILAARGLGLDCGPMSGFDAAKVNAEFFPDGKWKINLICNLGYGDGKTLFPRNPRLEFDEACRIL